MFFNEGTYKEIFENYTIGWLKNEEIVYLTTEDKETFENFLFVETSNLNKVEIEYGPIYYEFYIDDEILSFKESICIAFDNKTTDLEDFNSIEVFKLNEGSSTLIDVDRYQNLLDLMKNENAKKFKIARKL